MSDQMFFLRFPFFISKLPRFSNSLVFADSPILFLVLSDRKASFAIFGLIGKFLFLPFEPFGVSQFLGYFFERSHLI